MRTRASLLCSFAAIVQSAALAQTGDPRDLLERVSAKVTDALTRLPRYMCSLAVERAQYASESRDSAGGASCDRLAAERSKGRLTTQLLETDRVRLDVAIAARDEIYAWPGEKFSSHDPFDFEGQGALENGLFSSFLSAVFRSDAADFYWIGEKEVDGRVLAEYQFQVPLERSKYVFRSGDNRYTTAYDGTFLADPATGDLVRLSIRTDGLPAASGACDATTTLDYARTRLRDSEFLLPSQAQLDIFNADGTEDRNRAVYSSCREFVGDSAVRFEDLAGESITVPKTSAPGPNLPAGIKFRIRFSEAIDPETVSGGDRVIATLKTSIRDPASKSVLVPEGAEIAVRVVRLEHLAGPPLEIRLEVRLEAVDIAGTMVPFQAEAGEPDVVVEIPRRTPGPRTVSRPFLNGQLDSDPGIYVFQYQNVKPGFAIKPGLESNWVTR